LKAVGGAVLQDEGQLLGPFLGGGERDQIGCRKAAEVGADFGHHGPQASVSVGVGNRAAAGGGQGDRPREAPYPITEVADAENAARALRTHWRLGIDPILNLSELLEERGIKILSADLSDIDGLTAKVQRKNGEALPVIVIKKNAWSERKRFTLAHELGHMVMDVRSNVDAEKSANRFAGAFLMPAEALWREIGKSRTTISLGELLRLKELFGAGFQAIVYRCHDLGIIAGAAYRRLFQVFNQYGWRKPPYEEPGAIPAAQERPKRMERLCFRALTEGAISESKAAEIFRPF
jgi:Zn-dependent peptidase ImmA (M78 family)